MKFPCRPSSAIPISLKVPSFTTPPFSCWQQPHLRDKLILLQSVFRLNRNRRFHNASSPDGATIPSLVSSCMSNSFDGIFKRPNSIQTVVNCLCIIQTGSVGLQSGVLNKVQVDVVRNSDCQNSLQNSHLGKYFKLHKSFTCASTQNSVNPCKVSCPFLPRLNLLILVDYIRNRAGNQMFCVLF